jgi:hypothetical protein
VTYATGTDVRDQDLYQEGDSENLQRLVKYVIWLDATGAAGSLTFAGQLILAGRSSAWAAAPFLFFVLGLLTVGVRHSTDFALSISAFTKAVPGLSRHLRRQTLRVAMLNQDFRFAEDDKALQISGAWAIVYAKLFFICGVTASVLVLLSG